jgi:predicted ferric reductase
MAEVRVRQPSMRFDSIRRTAPRGAYHTAVASGLWLAVAGNAAVIVWLWVEGGNVSGVHSPGQLLNSIGRITGLLSAYLALVQVLLLTRLPFLERLVGFDKLTVWHRFNGKIVLWLVLAHVVGNTGGYALIDRISIPHEASILLSSYPGMVAATVGTALFLVVVITSLVIVRRRLRYETWYLVHLTAYAAIALAWVHQIPTGNEFITNGPAAAYWSSLYLVTLALLILFRLVQPVVQAFWYRLQVADVTIEGPGVVSLRITGRHLDKLKARAGQFFLWRFFARGRWWESHPFSLSAAPDGRSLRITVKNVGDFTSRIGDIKPGTRVIAEGPFGMFTDAARRREGVALIAGGIGITPIRALIEQMPGDSVVIYRAVRDSDLIFRDELEALKLGRRVRVCYVVGDHEAQGAEHLLSPEHLRRLIADIADRDVYMCGPPAMMNVLDQNVRQVGVPSKYIHIERFAL